MNILDRAIATVAPSWGASRAKSRVMAMYYQQAYEAVMPGRLRKRVLNHGSGNLAALMSIQRLRDYARQLERNHDISRGALSILVRNTVGADGIGVEPQPKTLKGDIHDDFAEQLDDMYAEWSESPEVTGTLNRAAMEQMLCRSWIRDGEVLTQHVMGYLPTLSHGSSVPYSVEMIESDLLPLEFNDVTSNILQGVERNLWGRPIAFHLFKSHPFDPGTASFPDRKRVSADIISHLKAVDRIGQVRGVSQFASVLIRLDDIKDYEESERVAAKIAASLAAVITKGAPDMFNDADVMNMDGTLKSIREMRFEPGMIIDGLRPGEDITMLDSKRPNPNVKDFRNGQLRAVASGMDASYSATSKDYNGSYSALRQELVDQYSAYKTLSNMFISVQTKPMFQKFVTAGILSGVIKVPKGVDRNTVTDALYVPPQMPWIDPQKEATANEISEDRAWESGPSIIRRRGGKPRDTAKQQGAWLRLKARYGIPDIVTGKLPPTVEVGSAGTNTDNASKTTTGDDANTNDNPSTNLEEPATT